MNRFISIIATVAFGMSGCLTATALDAAYYASQSRLANGKWGRVHVTDEGIQQVTYDQLRSWGFDTPEKVRVYGYGGTYLNSHKATANIVDDVQPTLCLHTDDRRLLFYGDTDHRISINVFANTIPYKVSRNYYSKGSYYLLTDSDAGGTLPSRGYYQDTTDPAKTQTQHVTIQCIEDEVENPNMGGAAFFGNRLSGGTSVDFDFDIADYISDGVFNVTMAGHEANTWGSYNVQMYGPSNLSTSTVNALSIMSQGTTSIAYSFGYGKMSFDAPKGGTVADGRYTFGITCPTSSRLDYLAVDRATLTYSRNNRLGDRSEMLMQIQTSTAGYNLALTEAGPTTLVWNVTDPSRVYEHNKLYETGQDIIRVTFNTSYGSTNGPGRMIAFVPSAEHHAVEYAGEVANQDIHGDETPDMVIVTTDELYDEAEALAEIHRRLQGITVNVYTQQQVFNEFSGSTPHANGIRRMAKMFYDRDPQKFKHLLMYGQANWDNRDLAGSGVQNLICYEVEPDVTTNYAIRHTSLNFCSDNYFGMLDDDFVYSRMYAANVSIGVGRLPVDKASASVVNAKIERYLSELPTVADHARVLLLSDDGDSNRHMAQSEELATTMLAQKPWLTFYRAHNLLYPRATGSAAEARKLVQNALLQGVGYFSFTGHGRPDYFTAESLWSKLAVHATPNTVYPIAMLATCDTYLIDHSGTGIAETMVLEPNGGAIAVVAAARSVFMDYNQALNVQMANTYAKASGVTDVGTFYRDAHNATQKANANQVTDLYLNTMCFNLCGDPALPLIAPAREAALNKVNGVAVRGDEAVTGLVLEARSRDNLKFEGVVIGADGETDASFNGVAEVTLYDAPHEVATIKLNNQDKDENVTVDESRLASVSVNVVNGEFSGTMFVPDVSYAGDKNRLVVTAVSDNVQAAGLYDGMKIVDNSGDVVVGEMPEIVEFYLNDRTFADGDEVMSSFTVNATISIKSAGLSVNSALGDGTKLILDGGKPLTGAVNAIKMGTDGTATFSLPVSEVADGRHTLTLSVADNLHQRVEKTISFVVVNRSATATLIAERDYARDSYTIDLESSLDATQNRLVIVDPSNNTVFTAENVSMPYTWNLTDMKGETVADGRYEAFMLVRDGHSYTSTQRISLVVIK